nr:MAG TPA: hypothetical protein [Caudoviricetes sp.]
MRFDRGRFVPPFLTFSVTVNLGVTRSFSYPQFEGYSFFSIVQIERY